MLQRDATNHNSNKLNVCALAQAFWVLSMSMLTPPPPVPHDLSPKSFGNMAILERGGGGES